MLKHNSWSWMIMHTYTKQNSCSWMIYIHSQNRVIEWKKEKIMNGTKMFNVIRSRKGSHGCLYIKEVYSNFLLTRTKFIYSTNTSTYTRFRSHGSIYLYHTQNPKHEMKLMGKCLKFLLLLGKLIEFP
jgi:hypothetical protein